MNEVITMTKERFKALMMETVWQMCDDDAKDSAAYARLMENIEEEQDDV